MTNDKVRSGYGLQNELLKWDECSHGCLGWGMVEVCTLHRLLFEIGKDNGKTCVGEVEGSQSGKPSLNMESEMEGVQKGTLEACTAGQHTSQREGDFMQRWMSYSLEAGVGEL